MAIGDALAAPLHWVYTWPAAQELRKSFAGGRISGYEATPAGMQHPDSWKYFQRCDPLKEPFPQAFGQDANEIRSRWGEAGTPYHASLARGDNSLNARIIARTVEGLVQNGCFDADSYVAGYLDTVVNGRADGYCNDVWVDESPRVLTRNLAKGFPPSASGLDDCCLTGLALAFPNLLAYAFNRDAADLACRAQLQATHKSEDMAGQAMWLGDLIRGILAATGASRTADKDLSPAAIKALFEAITLSFSNDKVSLPQVLEKFPLPAGEPAWKADEAAFHGPEAVFSLR